MTVNSVREAVAASVVAIAAVSNPDIWHAEGRFPSGPRGRGSRSLEP